MRLGILLAALLCAGGARAACDTAAGWPPGKPCRDASEVGVRDGVTDKSLQTMFEAGDLGGDAAFGTIGSAVADNAGDTLTVTDSSSINFTTTDTPDDLTAVALCGGLISCPGGSAITTSMSADRLLGRTTAGAGVVEEITVDATYLSLAAGNLSFLDSDVFLYSTQDENFNGFLDLADLAAASGCVDGDGDAACEIVCFPGSRCDFDIDEDTLGDLIVTTTSFVTPASQFRDGAGVGVGDPTAAGANRYAVSNSSCIGRDTATSVDRLFEDKNCNFPSVTTPTAGEGMLTDIIAKNTATHTLASTTGTQVTGLKLDLDGITAYEVVYNILSQSSDQTVGLAYGVTFTGTATFNCERSYVASAAQTIASGTGGPFTKEAWITATASTSTPNLGPNTGGVQTANATALELVRCLVVVTAAGDLQFWHASEAATNTSVMANSTARAVRIN